MKILHLFDSLKFLRTIFVAVACALVLYPGHAELRDDELPNGYKRLTGISYDTRTYYETNEKLYGSDTLTITLSNTSSSGRNVIGAYSGTGDDARNFSLFIYGNDSTSGSYLRHGTKTGRPKYGTGTRTLVIGPSGTDGFLNNVTYAEEDFETTATFWIGGLPNSTSTKYDGDMIGNITVSDRLKYIPCERVSDGEIGYYETFTGTFLENQGTGTPVSMGYDTSHIISTNPILLTLPAEYTELQYIESTGTQYIDTGIKGNENTKVEIRWQFPQTSSASGSGRIFGSRMGSTSDAFVVGTSDGMVKTSSKYFFAYDNQAYLTTNTVVATAVWLTIIHDRLTHSVNGTDFTKDYASNMFETPQNLKIFGYDNDGTMGYGRGMCAYVKIWDGNNLVRNFVPARRNSDGVLGMYDLMDSNPETAFHTNAGTGNFIAGEYKIKIATTKYNEQQFAPVETRLDAAVAAVNRVVTDTMTQAQAIDQIATTKQTRPDEGCDAKYCLLVEDENGTPHWYPIAGANGVAHNLPAGYTELQYIESNGSQYINTGIYATQNTAIETKFINLSGAAKTSVMIGDGWNGGKYQFSIVAQTGAPNRIGGLSRSLSDFWTTNREFIVQMNKTGLYVDGELLGWSGSATEFTSTNPLTLLGDPTVSGRGATVKLFYMKIYENDTMVRNFIPAKNASDDVGMYDLVSGQFFTNQGTGVFGEGPIVQ